MITGPQARFLQAGLLITESVTRRKSTKARKATSILHRTKKCFLFFKDALGFVLLLSARMEKNAYLNLMWYHFTILTYFYKFHFNFSPNNDPIKPTASVAVLFFSSSIGFTSTNSADVIIPVSASISMAK